VDDDFDGQIEYVEGKIVQAAPRVRTYLAFLKVVVSDVENDEVVLPSNDGNSVRYKVVGWDSERGMLEMVRVR
jgi:hypothetical protein